MSYYFSSGYYVANDCMCGYATHNTKSCNQKECSRYFHREVKMAQIELETENKQSLERFTKRYHEAIFKDK